VNGTGLGLCPVVVFSISHAQSFVSITIDLIFSCFETQVPVIII
jgi:hypothetical protein